MASNYCPYCNTKYTFQEHSGDYVHDCSAASTETLRNEDVLVIGEWEDYTGSGGIPTGQALLQGVQNELQGSRARQETNANFDGVTNRGNRKSTHRQRKHLEYIENP